MQENLAKSKLENYETIMMALVGRYLSVDSLAFKCSMDCDAVKRRLNFLIKEGLIDERQVHTKKLYALTKRGLAIHKTLTVTKRLDKLKIAVKAADEALMTLKFIDENEGSTQKRKDENY